MVTPQVSNAIYKARVSAAAMGFKGMKAALEMLANDIGQKPATNGWLDPTTDQLALRKRSSCPAAYQSLWNGPYLQNYVTHKTSALINNAAGIADGSIYYTHLAGK